jgi:hypothetical protein
MNPFVMFLVQRLVSPPLPPNIGQRILKLLPDRAIEPVAQLPIPIDLRPAVTPPIASRHIDDEITVFLLVMRPQIRAIAARTGRERIDPSLRHECCVGAHPRLVRVQVFERVLLLVLPFHVFLLVEDGVPPHIEQSVGPFRAPEEERAEIKATAVLGHNEVDRRGIGVGCCGESHRVEVGVCERVCDVQRVVVINVSVCIRADVVEKVVFQRICVLHDKCVQVQPPEPMHPPVSVNVISGQRQKKRLTTPRLDISSSSP